MPTVTAVSAGYAHTCALTSGGEARCWGYGLHGALGTGAAATAARAGSAEPRDRHPGRPRRAGVEFIRKEQADIKTGQTLILGRLDTIINQVGVQGSDLAASPAGRAVAERLADLAKASASHDERIAELDAWRDEIRGAVRVLSLFSALSSAVATLVTVLHLAHVAGW